jgi:hypothetical protein
VDAFDEAGGIERVGLTSAGRSAPHVASGNDGRIGYQDGHAGTGRLILGIADLNPADIGDEISFASLNAAHAAE